MAHEALIRTGRDLQEWLAESRAFLQWQRHRLWPLLRQWDATQQDRDVLLRGVLLAEAEEFFRFQRADLSAGERLFIEASLAEQARRRAEREAIRRREHEQAQLALARQLAAQAVNLSRRKTDVALLLSLESLRHALPAPDRTEMYASLSMFTATDAHPCDIHGAFFTADGTRLLTRDQAENLRLWDTRVGAGLRKSRLLAAPKIPTG